MSDSDTLITVTDLSRMLAVKPSTIYGWVNQNRLPYVKIGKLVRFSQAEMRRRIAHGTIISEVR